MMKKVCTLLLACIIAIGASAQISKEGFEEWHRNKFSMFIHFGLYSELGGVWNDEPVTRGYSEQIQSFAGIFSDWYGDTALRFNPTLFDADAIVSLAKEAGMRSIVITTKHHDGFCMFRTRTTAYNSYDATPAKRDYIKELADACRRGGLNFGMYYSLIDWHYPWAYPISSHNCDFITPQHHAFSKQQVTELLTNYGPVSELWFDMGSNTPEQSRELYELVHRLQPDCMVSGRLGNDQYDFSVMPDNAYPETALQCPWQSAVSMFKETWSYRSWQERGSAHEKAQEKLRSLIGVVAHGGNFLLNIGPKGDGSVVPFEREVLQEMGAWLKKYGDAIYGTEASPFREPFEWGNITRKGNNLYLILSGERPADGKITLNVPGSRFREADIPAVAKGNSVTFTLPENAYGDEIRVVCASFDRPVEPQPLADGRTPNYSYSCFDYYSNYRSTVSYQWNINRSNLKELEFTYTAQEAGKELTVEVDGKPYTVTLDAGKAQPLNVAPTTWGKRYLGGPSSGLFDAPATLDVSLEKKPRHVEEWKEMAEEQAMFPTGILESYYLMQEVESPRAQQVLVEVGAGNGIDVFLNGVSVMKHLNPYRCTFRTEKVLLPLQKGKNQVVLRLYNRFEKETGYLLRQADEQVVYRQKFTLPEAAKGRQHTVVVRQNDLPSIHSDTELANLSVR